MRRGVLWEMRFYFTEKQKKQLFVKAKQKYLKDARQRFSVALHNVWEVAVDKFEKSS